MITLDYLLSHSNLPGPRGNLELLHSFAKEAEPGVVGKCLGCIREDTANSPEEFAGMCGIVGYAMLHRDDIPGTFAFLRTFASHDSWRIREAVAIAVQEIAVGKMNEVLEGFRDWTEGNPLEQRAVVAALCEPKLLKNPEINRKILEILRKITDGFHGSEKLTESRKVLRQSLGYGWSVVVAHQPEEGRKALESYTGTSGGHIRWIVMENLKKNRLVKMDPKWVEQMKAAFDGSA
jgi:hypothetical protein